MSPPYSELIGLGPALAVDTVKRYVGGNQVAQQAMAKRLRTELAGHKPLPPVYSTGQSYMPPSPAVTKFAKDVVLTGGKKVASHVVAAGVEGFLSAYYPEYTGLGKNVGYRVAHETLGRANAAALAPAAGGGGGGSRYIPHKGRKQFQARRQYGGHKGYKAQRGRYGQGRRPYEKKWKRSHKKKAPYAGLLRKMHKS